MTEDTLLRRLAVTAAACCAAMSLAAYVFSGGALALAVLGGGLLAATSFGGITRSASALMPGAPGARRPNLALTIIVLVFRYGLLAFLAYVMIARLRMPPLALLAGASAVVAAVAIEAGRLLRQRKP